MERVCCAYIFAFVDSNCYILLVKRGPDATNGNFKWCVPGGHVEQGETYEECMMRELKEETNLSIEIDNTNIYNSFNIDYEDITININNYILSYVWDSLPEVSYDGNEIADATWVNINDIKNIDWAFEMQKMMLADII